MIRPARGLRWMPTKLHDRSERLPQVIHDIAWKAKVRLCARYRRLWPAKPKVIVTTALARAARRGILEAYHVRALPDARPLDRGSDHDRAVANPRIRAYSTVVSAPPPALGAAELQRLGAASKSCLLKVLTANMRGSQSTLPA